MNRFEVSVSYRWVLIAAVLYLCLPSVLFLVAWTNPVVAGVSVVSLFAGFYYFRSYFLSERHVIKLSISDCFSLVTLLLLLLLVTESVGFTYHVAQDCDFWVRNAMYESMVNESWPLYSARNEYFVYYLSFWLVPAALSKLCRFVSPEWWLFWWSYLGFALAGLLAFIRLRYRVITFVIGFLFIALIFGGFSSLVLGTLPRKMDSCQLPCFFSVLCYVVERYAVWYKNNLQYICGWLQISNTFHHAIALLLFLPFCLLRRMPFPLLLILSSLIVLITPLGALSLLPVLAVIGLQELKKQPLSTFKQSLLAAVFVSPLLLVAAAYFSVGSGSSVYFVWQRANYDFYPAWQIAEILLWLLFQWFNIYFLYLIFRGKFRNKKLFIALMMSAVLCSVVWMGRPVINELLYKGSLVPFACLSLLFALRWSYKTSLKLKILLVLAVMSTAVIPCRGLYGRVISSYSWNPDKMKENKADGWHGSMNHPESPVYAQFWATKTPNGLIFKVKDDIKLFSDI